MRIPTRYRRDENQSVARMLATMSTMDTMNCQTGGVSEAMRRNITMGAVGGKSEAAIAQMEFESFMMRTIMAKLIHVGAAARGMFICSYCSLSQVEASPANNEL